MDKFYKHIETAVIHEGYDPKQYMGSLAAPIFKHRHLFLIMLNKESDGFLVRKRDISIPGSATQL